MTEGDLVAPPPTTGARYRTCMLLALILACSHDFADCADTDCRARWLQERWPQQGEVVYQALEQVRDPMEHDLLLVGLAESAPGDSAALCDRIHNQVSRERCARITVRPHLWAEPAAPSSGARPGGGPRSRDVLPTQDREDPYADAPPNAKGCAHQADLHGCLGALATREARHRDAVAAAGACAAMGEDKWREECRFRAAEVVVRTAGFKGYRKGVGLCMGAGPFRANCLSHLVIQLVHRAPAATEREDRPWASLAHDVHAVRVFWQQDDPDFAPIVEQRAWSEALGFSYQQVSQVTGDPLDHLPETATPHVRASAVWRLMELEPEADLTLDDWVARATAALAARAGAVRGEHPPTPFQGVADLWPSDEGDEDQRPAVVYRSTSRRTTSPDPQVDLTLCVLEAAARLEHPDVVRQGLDHPDEAVRWTATRLLEGRHDASQHQPGMLQIPERPPLPPPPGGSTG